MGTPFGLESGSVGVLLVFPLEWPPHQNMLLTTIPTHIPDLNIKLLGGQTGFLEVWFDYRGNIQRVFTSARVDFPRGGEGVVFVVWANTGVNLSVGEHDVPPFGATDTVHQLELAPIRPGTGGLALDDPNAAARCASWVEWRRTYLSKDEVPAGRIAKTIHEQLTELEGAAARVKDILSFIEAGKVHWAGSLAVELRALIHWKKDQFKPDSKKAPSQIPLLFRVAQYKNLSLPVYMTAPQKGPVIESTQIRFDVFTLTHTSGYQRLGDLQEWLLHPALFDHKLGDWGTKDLIASYAETKGPGHYDVGVPSIFNILERSGFEDMANGVRFVYRVGIGVHALAEHVLTSFGVDS